MTTNIRITKNTVWGFLIIGLTTVLIVIGISLITRQVIHDPNDIQRDAVIDGIKANTAKLKCAVITWSSDVSYFGAMAARIGPEKSYQIGNGTHQLWWNNKKIAVSWNNKTTVKDPNGQVSSKQEKTFVTYDGKTFRTAVMPTGLTGNIEVVISKEPPNRFLENNYLQTVGWQGRSGFNNVSKATEPGMERWQTEEDKMLKRTFHNTRTGQIGIWTYDIEKNYVLVASEYYEKENTIQSKTTIQYKQFSGGVWFPVSVVTESFNIQNGELIYRSRMDVDINKSVFNDPSAIPDEVFELEIGPNNKVKDLTSLKTRLKRFLNDF